MRVALRYLFLAFILTFPTLASAQIDRYSDKHVGSIDIVLHKVGAENSIDVDAIRAGLKTKVGERFSQADFDEDLKHLSAEFDRVEPDIEIRQALVFITLNLWPKPVIRSIVFSGNRSISAAKLRKELGYKPGATFDRHEFNLAFHKLRELYVKSGFFESQLSYRVIPDPSTNEVDIQVTVEQGRSGLIGSVNFEGFTRKQESELVDMIQAKRYLFLTSWITGSGKYQSDTAEQDRYIILNYLQNQGYADAQVEVRITETPDARQIHVTFIADKGPRYHFGTIDIEGNSLFTDDEVRNQIVAEEGKPFSPDQLRESVRNLVNLYGSRGYIEANINYIPHLTPEENLYDVVFTIEEGVQYRVGLVRVFGNVSTQQRVLLHESRLVPGEVFDIRKLQQTEACLRNIGYFENVNVYTVRSMNDELLGPHYRDVYIEVEETGTGSIGLFFGFSSLDSISGGGEIIERNFNIAGFRDVFKYGPGALRGAGEFARLRLTIGKKQTSIYASWAKPFFKDTPWIVGFDIERSSNRRVSDLYTLKNTTLTVHGTYPCNRFVRYGIHSRLKYMDVRLHDKFEEVEVAILDDKGNPIKDSNGEVQTQPETVNLADRLSETLKEQARNDGILWAFGATWTYDSVDFCRTRGLRSVVELELAAVRYRWISLSYLNTYYRPLFNGFATLKLRGEVRFLTPIFGQASSNVPLNERYFLGGETTVRGYAPYSIGPQFASATVLGEREPRGGLSSVLLSAEVSRKFCQPIDGFIFVDGGSVQENPWSIGNSIQWSAGYGVRICIAGQMPFILGMGYPINPKNKSQIDRFFFSVGGQF